MSAVKERPSIECEEGADLTDAVRSEIEQQSEEIESVGVGIDRIVVRAGGGPPRFFISFPPDTPSYMSRQKLELKKFDVGQQMGGKMLSFYVTRRVTKGEGWQV